jgi:hypothetical protein
MNIYQTLANLVGPPLLAIHRMPLQSPFQKYKYKLTITVGVTCTFMTWKTLMDIYKMCLVLRYENLQFKIVILK